MTDRLKAIREQLDGIDASLQDLLTQRAQLAKQIGEIKVKQSPDAIFYRPEREAQILKNITARNQSLLSNDDLAAIFKPILNACLALQHPVKVSFLGPSGTFSHAACLKHFGSSITGVASDSIGDVFCILEAGRADYGVVPIENSNQGIIKPTLNALTDSELSVIGEVNLPIHMHLLRHQSDNTPLRRIYGHQQAFAQCYRWLEQHMPRSIEQIRVSSNGEAARRAQHELGAAAIAGDMAAKTYDLKIVNEHIHDEENNQTRFLVIGKQSVAATGDDKTTLMVYSNDEPGALLTILKPFAKYDVNLTLIESRAVMKRNEQYLFILDALGHQTDHRMKQVLDALKQSGVQIYLLGSYPRAARV